MAERRSRLTCASALFLAASVAALAASSADDGRAAWQSRCGRCARLLVRGRRGCARGRRLMCAAQVPASSFLPQAASALRQQRGQEERILIMRTPRRECSANRNSRLRLTARHPCIKRLFAAPAYKPSVDAAKAGRPCRRHSSSTSRSATRRSGSRAADAATRSTSMRCIEPGRRPDRAGHRRQRPGHRTRGSRRCGPTCGATARSAHARARTRRSRCASIISARPAAAQACSASTTARSPSGQSAKLASHRIDLAPVSRAAAASAARSMRMECVPAVERARPAARRQSRFAVSLGMQPARFAPVAQQIRASSLAPRQLARRQFAPVGQAPHQRRIAARKRESFRR